MTLNDLVVMQKAKVKALHVKGDTKRRFIEMGLTVGTDIEVREVAPLGDPIGLRVKGYSLSLRRADAAKIEVETIA